MDGGMNRSELRELVWDWADDPQGGYFTESIVNMRLNLAQKETQKILLSANKQYYTKCVKTTLVVGQAAYALPSDFIQVVRLEYVISGSGDTAVTQPIMIATPNQKDVIFQSQGEPYAYTFDKNNIVLQPVPQTARELRLAYSYLVADMTQDSDEPDVPEQFHEFLAVLAARDCFLKDGRSLQPIESKLALYQTWFKQIADQRNVDRPRMVVATDGGFGY